MLYACFVLFAVTIFGLLLHSLEILAVWPDMKANTGGIVYLLYDRCPLSLSIHIYMYMHVYPYLNV